MGLVTTEQRGAVRLVTYANPPFGTMTAQGSVEMLAALREAADDPAVRAVVITGGVPGIFVRHYDVGELSVMSDGLAGAPAAPAGGGGGGKPGGTFGELVDLIAAAPKPVIAAINGLCMGGGFEITLACDIRIAGADVAAIGLPETRVGIFPGGGGTQRLPRVIGEARALEMILRGRTVTGPEAGEIGMVHEVVADPLARALEIAAEFEAKGADGVAYAKRLTRAALDRPLAEGLRDERLSFVEVMKTPSAREGLKAGRPPAAIQTL
ncbi:enoyl-CoA hydratase/isomerase family protein [Phenylobacterium aquaticum]|uniref:enoyl-CoA hydratase/isomerase family protein n=1 Tax=Phenylobacterium aquaticum TaxID=1763816 RepID=UPI001F5D6F1F|nr:enoyl-CoA hydratase/isomerase family protein [Phenylobacterium aquaticum]MCI3134217.1 enoyl-CoA hydratase/isomerase family protein [Phenylobacterium aquaticum]